jgi:hypothetical protein
VVLTKRKRTATIPNIIAITPTIFMSFLPLIVNRAGPALGPTEILLACDSRNQWVFSAAPGQQGPRQSQHCFGPNCHAIIRM